MQQNAMPQKQEDPVECSPFRAPPAIILKVVIEGARIGSNPRRQ
jgi:hypothetical protein